MKTIYITPAGKTALLTTNFLEQAKSEFGFELALLLSDNAYVHGLHEKYHNENICIIPISNPYFGEIDYLPAVRRLVRQALIFGADPELIVVNSSGGTEKMTSIVKDAADILAMKFTVKRVFGVFDKNTKSVVFTYKPDIEYITELTTIEQEVQETLRLKGEMDAAVDLDHDHGSD